MNSVHKKLLGLGLGSALALSGAFLIPFEGERKEVYIDPVGILTSCYGHTGKELRRGQTFTEDECLDQLAEDLVEHNHLMMNYILVPISVKEQAAYLSFVYNVGVGNFSKSTLLRKLNKGDYEGACKELPRWNKAGGRVLKGLVRRRAAEMTLCLEGVSEQREQSNEVAQ